MVARVVLLAFVLLASFVTVAPAASAVPPSCYEDPDSLACHVDRAVCIAKDPYGIFVECFGTPGP